MKHASTFPNSPNLIKQIIIHFSILTFAPINSEAEAFTIKYKHL